MLRPGRKPRPTTDRLDFSPENLPWLDKVYAEIDAYVDGLPSPPDYDLREQLVRWMRDGYVVRESLIEHDLIDQYIEDIEAFATVRESSGMHLTIEGYGTRRARDFPPEAFAVPHLRMMDFHNLSVAGKELALHPGIVEFLGHVFREQVVAMQSLTFLFGTEQGTHQDFPYVSSGVLSHLAASWIALEDVHPDSGPLFYHEGSHTVRKFDWGDGLRLTSQSTRTVPEFEQHLATECAQRGYPLKTFCPRKGDVFFWHAGLAHGGSRVNNPQLTRRSFVTHYSSRSAYQVDRRSPDSPPWRIELNGAVVFGDQSIPDEEDRFRLRRSHRR